MKKVLIVLLVSLMVLVGCSKGGADDKGDVTIQFMHSSVEQERLDVLTKLVEKFELENPGIKVEQIPIEEDAYNTKVVTLAQSGKLPHVVEANQDFAKVMMKDELVNLDVVDATMNEIGATKFYDGALSLVKTEDGSKYGLIPISGWVQGVWYDKAKFAEKGISEPNNWQELLSAAKSFHNPESKENGIAIPTAESVMTEQVFSQFALSNNANVFDAEGNIQINSEAMVEALEYYKELAQYTMPGSNDVTEVKDAFMNGTSPMAMYSTYILPSVYAEGRAADIGFIIPENKDKAVFGTVTGLTLTAGHGDAENEASKKLIEFMAKAENNVEYILMSPAGAQPVNRDVVELEQYLNHEVIVEFGELSEIVAKSFDDLQLFGLVEGKNFQKMGEITNKSLIAKAVNAAVVSGKDVKEVLEEAQKEAIKE